MSGQTILVIDDQEEIGELISHYLMADGFKTVVMNDPFDIFKKIEQHRPSLIILDIVLPGTDGIEICRELRKTTHIPVIFISSKKDDIDKILALGVGGDDYVTKPFSPRELVARVKAHLRRSAPTTIRANNRATNPLKFENLIIDPESHSVTVYGNNITLSAKEFELLLHLARHPNRMFNSEELFNKIWGMDHMGDLRTVMVHISTLRKKIEQDPANSRFIVTIRGVGYKFIGRPLNED